MRKTVWPLLAALLLAACGTGRGSTPVSCRGDSFDFSQPTRVTETAP